MRGTNYVSMEQYAFETFDFQLQERTFYNYEYPVKASKLMTSPYPEQDFYVNFLENSKELEDDVLELEGLFNMEFKWKKTVHAKLSEYRALASENHPKLIFYFVTNKQTN
jgi:hypothetical protein